jgi:hypothetical protein
MLLASFVGHNVRMAPPMKSSRDAAESPGDPLALSDFDWQSLPWDRSQIGVILVDHGSRREQSNQMLLSIVDLYQTISPFEIIEPAHMELAEPSIATAFELCVQRGAQLVVMHPYFLLPGRHWDQDIPTLAAAAGANHPDVQFLVTSPLSLHPLMAQVIQLRIEQCLMHAAGIGSDCELCAGTNKCQFSAK